MNTSLHVRITWGRLLVLALAVFIAAAAWTYHAVIETVSDAYAVWDTAELVINHLEQRGEWPRSWADLLSTPIAGSGDAHRYSDLESRVELDFLVDVERLRVLPDWEDKLPPPIRVIRAKSGRKSVYAEPNYLIWEYLHGRRHSRFGPDLNVSTRPVTQPG